MHFSMKYTGKLGFLLGFLLGFSRRDWGVGYVFVCGEVTVSHSESVFSINQSNSRPTAILWLVFLLFALALNVLMLVSEYREVRHSPRSSNVLASPHQPIGHGVTLIQYIDTIGVETYATLRQASVTRVSVQQLLLSLLVGVAYPALWLRSNKVL